MKIALRIGVTAMALSLGAASAAGDGMIVPVRPELPVRGSWSVKYHHVKMLVRDQVASVTIDQEFVNDGKGMIEVKYLFPVPPGAAIDAMTMIVNGKEFKGRLLEADKARKIYEDIVRRKKDPALLEYAGFGLYRTKAFPLEPGKPCKVVVHYSSVCKKDRDLVEVWYPLNTEKFSAKAIDSVRVAVDIKAKADITAVYSPTHDLTTQHKDPRHVTAVYEAKKTLPATDFQVFYKAANEDVGATFLTHQPDKDKDGYFLLLVSPNPKAAKDKITPKDIVIVLDHSGSMSGKKLEQAKKAVSFILKNLNAKDRFNVVAYNDSVEPFFSGLTDATGPKVAEASDRLDRITAGAGTNIHEALQVAMKMLPDDPKDKAAKRPAYVIFMTDGLPTVGKTREEDILKDTQEVNDTGARLFAFGVGYDVNVRLLDKLVRDNRGRSDYVKEKEPVEAKVSSLYAKIKNPVMTDLTVKTRNLRLRDLYPRQMPDLFDGDQIILVGRYRCEDAAKLKRDGDDRRTTVEIAGMFQGKQRGFEYPAAVRPGGRDTRFVFVEKLWAVRRVGWLLDQIQLHGKSKEVLDELIRLSRTYGIMTPYTSFLADESVQGADEATVREKARRGAKSLGMVKGADGQRGAKNRQELSQARRAPAAATGGGGVHVFGFKDKKSYESGRRSVVTTVRQAGNQTLYRRDGRVWVAEQAGKVDLEKDAAKIKAVKRFSDEYFDLVRKNTVEENQVLSTQRAGEELVVKLRGQLYRIK